MSGGLRGLGIDFDSVEATHQQAEILRTKQAIREIYQDTYRELVELCERHFRGVPGKLLEIGSGGGFFKDVCPQVITSDAKDLPFVDMRLEGETLPFASGELRCIFAVHVLHHIPDIRAFLREALRVLQPGGGLICVEPYWSPLAQFVYRRFHTEPFDMRAASWDMQRGGPMTTANQALSYLLLERDREQFAAEFPELRLVYRRPQSPFPS
jgi:SAM-dependent methyltransferase